MDKLIKIVRYVEMDPDGWSEEYDTRLQVKLSEDCFDFIEIKSMDSEEKYVSKVELNLPFESARALAKALNDAADEAEKSK